MVASNKLSDTVHIHTCMHPLNLKADKLLLILLWLHLPFAGFFIPYPYGTWKEGLICGLGISIIGTISYYFSKGTFIHRLLMGLLLLSYSIVFITIQFGRIEMHFHVFGALSFLLLYRDWKVIPPAALLILIQHAVFNYCQVNQVSIGNFPLIVFNYGSGWDIVFLHGILVIFECSVLIYYAITMKNQHIELYDLNKNLENIVRKRTKKIFEEKEKVESYSRALNQFCIIAITDAQGDILEINHNFENISGYSKGELIGENYSILNSSYHSKNFFESMWNTIRTGNMWQGQIRNKNKDNDYFWVDSIIGPFKMVQGRPEKYIAIHFDITQRKKDEELIVKQQAQIVSQSKLSSLGEMAGGIAHEINNPLCIISTSSYMIKKELKKKNIDILTILNTLNGIDQTIERISKIIIGLKNISRDPIDEDFETTSISEIIQDATSLCVEKYKSRGIDFSVKYAAHTKDIIFPCMRIQISQVLINLISNAGEAIESLTNKWINIQIQKNENNLEIRVSNSGPKIPKDIRDKIFRPFFTTKPVGKGTGLGLSLSNSIALKHNGSLEIDDSHPNTCFKLTLPLQQTIKNKI